MRDDRNNQCPARGPALSHVDSGLIGGDYPSGICDECEADLIIENDELRRDVLSILSREADEMHIYTDPCACAECAGSGIKIERVQLTDEGEWHAIDCDCEECCE